MCVYVVQQRKYSKSRVWEAASLYKDGFFYGIAAFPEKRQAERYLQRYCKMINECHNLKLANKATSAAVDTYMTWVQFKIVKQDQMPVMGVPKTNHICSKIVQEQEQEPSSESGAEAKPSLVI
jgi:hypothetical protein